MFTQFRDHWSEEVCSENCRREIWWRKTLAAKNEAYYPCPDDRLHQRTLRIAELDPIPSLDSLIADLEGIPDLTIDRYLIPKDVYPLFAAHPPPIGVDFPVATVEVNGDQETRVYGLLDVTALLNDLLESAFAVTRKMKAKKIK